MKAGSRITGALGGLFRRKRPDVEFWAWRETDRPPPAVVALDPRLAMLEENAFYRLLRFERRRRRAKRGFSRRVTVGLSMAAAAVAIVLWSPAIGFALFLAFCCLPDLFLLAFRLLVHKADASAPLRALSLRFEHVWITGLTAEDYALATWMDQIEERAKNDDGTTAAARHLPRVNRLYALFRLNFLIMQLEDELERRTGRTHYPSSVGLKLTDKCGGLYFNLDGLRMRLDGHADPPPSVFDTAGRIEYLIRLWARLHELWVEEASISAAHRGRRG